MEEKTRTETEEINLHGTLNPEDKKKLRDISQISLWLDDYTDIFSDFDPRPYSERTLSDDFLLESRKAIRDTATGKIQFTLLVPDDKRNVHDEGIIKKRLRSYFKTRFESVKKQNMDTIKQGILFTSAGVILMFIATFIIFAYTEKSFLTSFLFVVLEPGGWFLFWEGLNLIIFKPKELKHDLEFYHKMSSCEVSFISY